MVGGDILVVGISMLASLFKNNKHGPFKKSVAKTHSYFWLTLVMQHNEEFFFPWINKHSRLLPVKENPQNWNNTVPIKTGANSLKKNDLFILVTMASFDPAVPIF